MIQKIAFAAVLVMSSISTLFAQQTHIVDLSGTGDFTSIHAAVDAASSGDTIRVQPDQYAFTADLGAIEVDKKLVIIGSVYMPVEDWFSELIDITGSGFFDLTGTADGTVIKGFRVQGAAGFLDTESGTANVTIEENLFIEGVSVLYFQGTADTVRSNIFAGTSYYSVRTSNSNTQITNNLFTENAIPNSSTGLIYVANATGVVIAYNLFLNTASTTSFTRPDINVISGSPEVYSNGFVNSTYTIRNTGSAFITNNGFYNSGSTGLNAVDENPVFVEFDSDNQELTLEELDENQYDLSLDTGSNWIDAGRTGTPYLDTDGSRSDIGIFAGSNPFDDGRGAPSVPVVIQFQVSPTTVSPTGTITIQATGRIGAGDN